MPAINERTDQSASLVMLLFMVPFFKPIGWSMITEVNDVFHAWKIVSLVVLVVYLVAHAERLSIDIGLLGLIVFWLIYVSDDIAMGGPYFDAANNAISIVGLMLMCQVEAKLGNAERLVRTLKVLFSVLLIVQVVTLFVVSGGTVLFKSQYRFMYFLGEDNYSAFSTVPMMGIILYCDLEYGEERRISWFSWVLLGALVFGYVYVQSVAASASLIILAIFAILQNSWKGLSRAFSANKMSVLFAVMLVLVMFCGLSFALSEVIASFVNKSIATLNGRTDIWRQASSLIAARPAFGYGDLLQIKNDHAQNILLEAVLRAGFVGAAGFTVFVLSPFVQGRNALVSKSGFILVATFVAYLAIGFFDFYMSLVHFFVLIGVARAVQLSSEREGRQQEDGLSEFDLRPDFVPRRS